MEIECRSMAYCCGAWEIGKFGGGESWTPPDWELPTKEALLRAIKARVKSAKLRGLTIIFATTMNNQPNAAAALKELGFHGTEPAESYKDSGRTIQGWVLPLSEFKEV